jgi:arginine/lysine/ornithine decarboxylase
MVATSALYDTVRDSSRTARRRHSDAPLVAALERYQDRQTVAFSTPGHKRGSGLEADIQRLLGKAVFDADVWLNMADLDNVLGTAEELAADAWGAEAAHFLVNGSSSGNHALLQAQLQPGDEVIIARDAHRSMLAGLIATGAVPVFVAPALHEELGISLGIEPRDIARALQEHPRARMVVITSPSYHGVASDIAAIAQVAHEYDVPLYVDQAWGAHLRFHPSLPVSAMEAGADAAVISAHKTLSSLSQGAILLVQGERINRSRLGATVRMAQSSSRNLPILLSLDTARRQMALHGWALMELTMALAARARAGLQAIPGVQVVDADGLGLPAERFDATRLVIDTQELGLDGYSVERILRDEFGIAPEMSDRAGIVCLITIGDTRQSVDCLIGALTALAREVRGALSPFRHGISRSVGQAIAPGEMAMTPREAFFAESRPVPLPVAIGEVAAELIVPYPPGIPVLVPGERIAWDKLMYLAELSARGGSCSGAADPTLLTLRVVAD